MHMRFLGIGFTALLLNSCGELSHANDFMFVPPNATTKCFQLGQHASERKILVNKRVNLKQYKRLAVVALKVGAYNIPDGMQDEEDFWTQSIQSLHYFDDVVSTDDLPVLLQNSTRGGSVPKLIVSEEAVRYYATKVYGKFLLVELSTGYSQGDAGFVTLVMSVKDSASGAVLFKVTQKQSISYTFKENYNAALNAFSDWVRENS